MTATRREVFERLAAETDAETGRATTAEALAAALDAEREAIDAHLCGLEACELVRTAADGRVRITITGEELLALDVDDVIVVPPPEGDADG